VEKQQNPLLKTQIVLGNPPLLTVTDTNGKVYTTAAMTRPGGKYYMDKADSIALVRSKLPGWHP